MQMKTYLATAICALIFGWLGFCIAKVFFNKSVELLEKNARYECLATSMTIYAFVAGCTVFNLFYLISVICMVCTKARG